MAEAFVCFVCFVVVFALFRGRMVAASQNNVPIVAFPPQGNYHDLRLKSFQFATNAEM